MRGRVYADYNASCPLAPAAADALRELLQVPPVNPGSVHTEGQRARGIVERARDAGLRLLGVGTGRWIFTSSATEANNTLISTLGDRRIVTSPMEHASVLEPVRRLKRGGNEIVWLPNDECGRIDLDALGEAVRAGNAAVVLGAANGEVGNLNDVAAVASACREYGALFHVDAAQVFGRLDWSPPDGVTSVTASSHKFGGPQGVGALWVAGELQEPLLLGGAQERGARAGTENVLCIGGFAAAVADFDAAKWSAIAPSRDRFEAILVERACALVNGDVAARLPNTSNVSLVGADSETMVMALDLEGVACSAGSACAAGSTEDSHVIVALGHGRERARSALRFSFGPGFDLQAAERLADTVVRVTNRCRRR